MRTLEVRRHSMRVAGQPHLSQIGVALARRLGADLGPFDRVITSPLPRAIETAVAMGFAVDETLSELAEMGAEVSAEVNWSGGFPEIARAIRQGGATARYAGRLATLWHSLVRLLPPQGRALVISHGGIIEAGAIACLPHADHPRWGPPCDYCDGVRLLFDGERFTAAEILRASRQEPGP